MLKQLQTYLGAFIIAVLLGHAFFPHHHHYQEIVTEIDAHSQHQIEHCVSFNDVVLQKTVKAEIPNFVFIAVLPELPENSRFYRFNDSVFLPPYLKPSQIPVRTVSPTRGSPFMA